MAFTTIHQPNRQPDTMKRKLAGHLRQRRQNLIPCSLGRRRPRKNQRPREGKHLIVKESVVLISGCNPTDDLLHTCSFLLVLHHSLRRWLPTASSHTAVTFPRTTFPNGPGGVAFKQQDGSSYHSPNALLGQVRLALALLLLPSAVTQGAVKLYVKICHGVK